MTRYDATHLIKPFTDLINDDSTSETVVHHFLEEHSEFIPLPFLLGHDVQWNSVISQFELDRGLVPDFAFLTKNTAYWRLVLIELERPSKKLFIENPFPDFHSDTRQAIAQLNEYKAFVAEHPDEIRRRLGDLMQPVTMRNNPLEVRYALVIGRNREEAYPSQHSPRIRLLQEEQKIQLMTYDSIVRSIVRDKQLYRRNILGHKRNGWRLKHAHAEETSLFSYFTPGQLELPDEAKSFYKNHGYHIDEWYAGEKLTINNRIAKSRESEFLDATMKSMNGPK